ncbi:MAG: hypothetical protein H7066_05640 [Cytophagaceae bacterium]|nr:hypothetical protein [Gemmatimonadaceae bacterium]
MPNDGSAQALRQALSASGFAFDVDAREGLALLRPADGVPIALDAAGRRRVQDLARQHGFTHAALELLPPAGGSCASSSP